MTNPLARAPEPPERYIPPAYENEDGWAVVPVEEEPDRDRAGQGLADDRGLIYTFEARGPISTQDCECSPPQDECFDNPGEPCVVRENVDCWQYQGWDAPSPEIEADILSDNPDRDLTTHPIYRPTRPRPSFPWMTR